MKRRLTSPPLSPKSRKTTGKLARRTSRPPKAKSTKGQDVIAERAIIDRNHSYDPFLTVALGQLRKRLLIDQLITEQVALELLTKERALKILTDPAELKTFIQEEALNLLIEKRALENGTDPERIKEFTQEMVLKPPKEQEALKLLREQKDGKYDVNELFNPSVLKKLLSDPFINTYVKAKTNDILKAEQKHRGALLQNLFETEPAQILYLFLENSDIAAFFYSDESIEKLSEEKIMTLLTTALVAELHKITTLSPYRSIFRGSSPLITITFGIAKSKTKCARQGYWKNEAKVTPKSFRDFLFDFTDSLTKLMTVYSHLFNSHTKIFCLLKKLDTIDRKRTQIIKNKNGKELDAISKLEQENAARVRDFNHYQKEIEQLKKTLSHPESLSKEKKEKTQQEVVTLIGIAETLSGKIGTARNQISEHNKKIEDAREDLANELAQFDKDNKAEKNNITRAITDINKKDCW